MNSGIQRLRISREGCRKVIVAFLLCCGLSLVSPLNGATPQGSIKDREDADGTPHGALGKVTLSLSAVTEAGEKLDLVKATKGWKVIYFWSSTCPCVSACQTLSLFPLFRAFKERDVTFYAVASNPSDFAVKRLADGTERAFLRLSGGAQFPPYPIVIDTNQEVANQLKAHSASQTFILDPQNRVVFSGDPDDAEEVRRKTGRSNIKTKNYLEDALKEGLAGKTISRPISPVLGCKIERVNREKLGT